MRYEMTPPGVVYELHDHLTVTVAALAC